MQHVNKPDTCSEKETNESKQCLKYNACLNVIYVYVY